MVQLMVAKGADVTRSREKIGLNSAYGTSLRAAMSRGHEDVTNFLLRVEIADAAAKTAYFEQALHGVAEDGRREMILLLLETTDVDVNCINADGQTPLMAAVCNNQVQTARLLLRRGADANILTRGRRQYALVEAVYWGLDAHALIRDLVRTGKDPNLRDKDGNTALAVAAGRGHEKVVKLLLAHGADPEATNKFGDTALDVAEAEGKQSVVELLDGLEVK